MNSSPELPPDELITTDPSTGYRIKLRTEQDEAGEPTTRLVAEKDPAAFAKKVETLGADAINGATDKDIKPNVSS